MMDERHPDQPFLPFSDPNDDQGPVRVLPVLGFMRSDRLRILGQPYSDDRCGGQ